MQSSSVRSNRLDISGRHESCFILFVGLLVSMNIDVLIALLMRFFKKLGKIHGNLFLFTRDCFGYQFRSSATSAQNSPD